MRKIFLVISAMVISTASLNAAAIKEPYKYTYATGRENVVEKGNTLTNIHIEALVNRVNTINEMDKSRLSAAERKELRNELRDIKKELKGNGVYLYLSATAILIIILLLILL